MNTEKNNRFTYLDAYGNLSCKNSLSRDVEALLKEYQSYSKMRFDSYQEGEAKYGALFDKIKEKSFPFLADYAVINDLLWSIEYQLLDLGIAYKEPVDVLLKHFSNMLQLASLSRLERMPSWACILARELFSRGESAIAKQLFHGAADTLEKLEEYCRYEWNQSIVPLQPIFSPDKDSQE